MKLVRLADFGPLHAILYGLSQEQRESVLDFRSDERNILRSGRTLCGKEYPVGAYVIGDGEPTCKTCLRCLAGPLGPYRR